MDGEQHVRNTNAFCSFRWVFFRDSFFILFCFAFRRALFEGVFDGFKSSVLGNVPHLSPD